MPKKSMELQEVKKGKKEKDEKEKPTRSWKMDVEDANDGKRADEWRRIPQGKVETSIQEAMAAVNELRYDDEIKLDIYVKCRTP